MKQARAGRPLNVIGKAIEKEAEKLCEMLTIVDDSENKVQQIKGLGNVDLVAKGKNA